MVAEEVHGIHKIIDWVHSSITPYLLGTAIMAGALIDEDMKSIGSGFLASIAPHLFVFTFLPFGLLVIIWACSVCIRRKWHHLFGTVINWFFEMTMRVFFALKDFWTTKVVAFVVTCSILVTFGKWLYYHFDIFGTFRRLGELILGLKDIFFDLPAMGQFVSRWSRRSFLGWIISPLHYILGAADAFVAEYAIPGIIAIIVVSVFAIIIVAIVVACIRDARGQPAPDNVRYGQWRGAQ